VPLHFRKWLGTRGHRRASLETSHASRKHFLIRSGVWQGCCWWCQLHQPRLNVVSRHCVGWKHNSEATRTHRDVTSQLLTASWFVSLHSYFCYDSNRKCYPQSGLFSNTRSSQHICIRIQNQTNIFVSYALLIFTFNFRFVSAYSRADWKWTEVTSDSSIRKLRLTNIQLMRTSYIPKHYQDDADSEYKSYVG